MTDQPIAVLRKRIRSASRQYRHNNDNSPSLFHPTEGFVYGYDVDAVEAALNEYETSLPSDFVPQGIPTTKEEELIRAASMLSATNDEGEVKNFANAVIAYLISQMHQKQVNPLRLLKTDFLEPIEEDEIED